MTQVVAAQGRARALGHYRRYSRVVAGIIMMVIIVIIMIIIVVRIVHLQEQVVVLGNHSVASKHTTPSPSKSVMLSDDFLFFSKKNMNRLIGTG